MDFNEYQKEAWKLALPESRNETYLGFGLANEAGEVLGKLKKVVRGDFVFDDIAKELVRKELGDVQWYLSGLASLYGFSLERIAVENIKKLQGRQNRGCLRGDGDTR